MHQRFFLSGLFAAAFAVAMGVLVMTLPDDWNAVLLRGTAALLGGLAAVAAEALWRPRPWAWRASAALALAHTLAAFAVAIAIAGMGGIGMAGAYLFFSSFVVLPILANLYERTHRSAWASAVQTRTHGPGGYRHAVHAPPSTAAIRAAALP